MKQMSFSDLAYRTKKKQTRRERFLQEMDGVLPRAMLLKPIERKYPKPGNVSSSDRCGGDAAYLLL